MDRLISAVENVGVQPESQGSPLLAEVTAMEESRSVILRLVWRAARPDRTLSNVPIQKKTLLAMSRHRTNHRGGRRP